MLDDFLIMYYKVINKESDVYKRLRAQREKEKAADDRNRKKIEELLGFKWTSYYGKQGRQGFRRVIEYSAFVPNEGEIVTKAVKPFANHKNAYEPNRRTKSGRALYDFLTSGKESFAYYHVLRILDCDEIYSRFTIPFMELIGDTILLYLDENHIPKNKDVIEITKKEFDAILNNV